MIEHFFESTKIDDLKRFLSANLPRTYEEYENWISEHSDKTAMSPAYWYKNLKSLGVLPERAPMGAGTSGGTGASGFKTPSSSSLNTEDEALDPEDEADIASLASSSSTFYNPGIDASPSSAAFVIEPWKGEMSSEEILPFGFEEEDFSVNGSPPNLYRKALNKGIKTVEEMYAIFQLHDTSLHSIESDKPGFLYAETFLLGTSTSLTLIYHNTPRIQALKQSMVKMTSWGFHTNEFSIQTYTGEDSEWVDERVHIMYMYQ